MDEQFIRDRLSSLRQEKQVSERKMSLDLGHSTSYIRSITSGRALPSMNIIPLGSHQFPASEPPGNGIFHLQSHHNILWQHTYLISL